MKTLAKIAAMTALVTATTLVQAGPAAAQDTASTTPAAEVDQDIKGTVGLALVGIELGLMMPGITGLTDAWAWATFPAIGAAGGVLAGIFVFEQADPSKARAKGAVAVLSVGLGLALPTAIASLAIAGKRKEARGFTLRQRRQMAAAKAGSGLVRFSPEGTFVRAPGIAPLVGSRTADGRTERGTMMSLVSGRF